MRIGIVGGGIIGCASAFELARLGADVAVFEARSPGGGATGASAGILAPYIEGHEGGTLLELTTEALAGYGDFVRRVRAAAATPFEYRRCGTLEIADSPERGSALRSRAASAPQVADAKWLSPSELTALEPAVSTANDGALLCGAHGFVAVVPFLSALVQAAERFGASFYSGVVVQSVELFRDHCEVRTQAGSRSFDRILLCAGSWASALDPLDEIRGNIRPIKGQLIVLDWMGPPIHRVLWSSEGYIVPWEDGTTLAGATSEDVGFDERPTVVGVAGLLGMVQRMLRGGGSAVFREVRVGLRPVSEDGLPLLRPSARDPRIFYATGHFRNGVLLAPLSAERVARYFLSGQ